MGFPQTLAEFRQVMSRIRDKRAESLLLGGLWGIEREALRIDPNGLPADTPHPFPPERQDITVDFAENQIEFITTPHNSPELALNELKERHKEFYKRRPQEYLWPLSAPGRWDRPDLVQPASFRGYPGFKDARAYRRSLVERYGTARQILSGIHVNISFGEDFIWFLKESFGDHRDIRLFRDDLYIRLIRNFVLHRSLAVFLFSASPITDTSYAAELFSRNPGMNGLLKHCGTKTAGLRQGPAGYTLPEEIEDRIGIKYLSLDEYVSKLRKASETVSGEKSLISGAREFYAPVRPKPSRGSGLQALEKDGIGYVELRSFDLDPHEPAGIGMDALRLATVMAITAVLVPDGIGDSLKVSRELSALSSLCTLGPQSQWGRDIVMVHSAEFLDAMSDVAKLLPTEYAEAVANIKLLLKGKAERSVERYLRLSREQGGTLMFGLKLAKNHKRLLTDIKSKNEKREQNHGLHDIRV